MPENSQSLLSSFGRTLRGVATMISVAREMQGIYATPESVFRARGTTRDAAVRAAMKRI
ncbi:MAG: hypothetical protein WAU86_21865 [Oricola sp.]